MCNSMCNGVTLWAEESAVSDQGRELPQVPKVVYPMRLAERLRPYDQRLGTLADSGPLLANIGEAGASSQDSLDFNLASPGWKGERKGCLERR
jgi:hypothetical protein